ncbi:DsbA family protein [Candidatus Pacebacteria bacterium]|nr:DsbA family protein [Candidatus Paceibacterota bacterium]
MKINTTATAIFVGFGLVAAAIYVSGNNQPSGSGVIAQNGGQLEQAVAATDSPAREGNRHVYGNIDAPVTIVEFSDYECPYCARLHPTLEKLVDSSNGQVNWEYRHLPLPNHRNAEMAAAVGECVSKHAGEEAFWNYSNTIFNNQRSVNTGFLTDTAVSLGVGIETLQTCVNTEEVQTQVAQDLATARAFGGSGTPFSVVMFEDGTNRPVSGALPYENWVTLLNL